MTPADATTAEARQRSTLAPRDYEFLRRAFELPDVALACGERPFGAVIVDPAGKIAGEGYNCTIERDDITAHAEVTAIRRAYPTTDRDRLAACTLYSSAEPCAMCAGAIYWANIRRVVFGLGEQRLRALRNVSERTAALTAGCTAVLATGGHATEVIGAVLEDEAIKPHLAFWSADKARHATRPREHEPT
jgi:tRNA(Arg) A34 adenosine deaminase TadA